MTPLRINSRITKAAMTLLLCMLTTMTAWAQNITLEPALKESYMFTGNSIKPTIINITYNDDFYDDIRFAYQSNYTPTDPGYVAVVRYGNNILSGNDSGHITITLYHNGELVLDPYEVKFDILPREVTLIVDDCEKYYGDPDPAFTCHFDPSTTAVVHKDTVSYWNKDLSKSYNLVQMTREAGETLGTYAINSTRTLPFEYLTPNMVVTAIIPGKMTIKPNPADLSVNEAGDEYTIHTATGWENFCDLIEGGESFSGKTVKLGADITVTRMAGSEDKYFCGTFDGQGNTLTLNYGTADNPIDAQFVAPFVMTYWNTSPIFRNLTIDGHIYEAYTGSEAHNVGGLIGHLYGTITIENCTSNVNITSTGGAGGFVGLCEHTVNFTDCMSSTVIHSAGGNNSGFVGWSRASGYAINFTGCVFNGKLLQVGCSGGSNGGFIGWTGSNKTVTITNCLVNPAALSNGETMASDKSATFARGWNETTTATNSYYTRALGIAQGIAPHTITAGENVTIEAVSPVGEPVENGTYSVSGITAYAKGITRTVGDVTTFYYGAGDQVSLTLGNTAEAPLGYQYDGYTASAGTLSGSTLTMPDQDVTISLGNLTLIDWATATDGNTEATAYMIYNKEQLNMLATRVNHSNKYSGKYFKLGADIKYAHGDFNESFYNNYTVIGIDSNLPFCGTFDGQNHVVSGIRIGNSTVSDRGLFGYIENAKVKNVILADASISGAFDIGGIVGCMKGGTVEDCHVLSDVTITLYNESDQGVMGFGGIVGYNDKGYISYCTSAASCTYSNVNKKADFCGGITSYNNDGHISNCLYLGNTLNATAYAGAITGSGDRGIISNCYYTSTTIQGKDKDGNTIDNNVCIAGYYYGGGIFGMEDALVPNEGNWMNTYFLDLMLRRNQALTAVERTTPLSTAVDITLSGRKLLRDGNWNTLCLPFDVEDGDDTDELTFTGTPLEGAIVKTLGNSEACNTGFDASTGILSLDFVDADHIEAGMPYIVKWTKPDGYDDNPSDFDISNPVFTGVTIQNKEPNEHAIVSLDKKLTFVGQYSPFYITADNIDEIILMSTGNRLGYSKNARTLKCFRCHFYVPNENGAEAPVRSFVLDFGEEGEATGIASMEDGRSLMEDVWYDLSGRKLSGKPTEKGIYIYNGRKIAIL